MAVQLEVLASVIYIYVCVCVYVCLCVNECEKAGERRNNYMLRTLSLHVQSRNRWFRTEDEVPSLCLLRVVPHRCHGCCHWDGPPSPAPGYAGADETLSGTFVEIFLRGTPRSLKLPSHVA